MISKSEEKIKSYWKSLQDLSGDEVGVLLSELFQNRKDSHKKYKQFYYLILIFGFLYFLLTYGELQTINIFGLQFSNVSMVEWIITTLLSFFIYAATINFMVEIELLETLKGYSKTNLMDFDEHDFIYLSIRKDFFNFERSQVDKDKFGWFMSITISIIFLFLPIGIVVTCMVNNIVNWADNNYSIFKIINIIISSLLLIRSVAIIFNRISK